MATGDTHKRGFGKEAINPDGMEVRFRRQPSSFASECHGSVDVYRSVAWCERNTKVF